MNEKGRVEKEGDGEDRAERIGQDTEVQERGNKRARRPGLISPDGFAITVQIIIPLPSTSIDISLRIYILRGYDPKPTPPTFPIPSNPGINPGKAGTVERWETIEGARQERRGRGIEGEAGREGDSQRVFMGQKNIDRSRAHEAAFNNR